MKRKPLPEEFFASISKKRFDSGYNAMMRIHDAAKLYHDRLRRLSDHEGLPSGYRMLIFHLARLDKSVTQLELVKLTHLKPPTVSVTLKKMEQDGIVKREVNKDDLRETFISLTDKGKKIDEQIHLLHKEGDSIALNNFSNDELNSLNELLNKVIDNLLSDRT